MNNKKTETAWRVEKDLLGAIRVPADALYGAQTQRALENFPVGRARRIGDFPVLIDALMLIKEACAEVNGMTNEISPSQAAAIAGAARYVRKEKLYSEFPIHHLHGGGGTSANMNANEVLANLAGELLGGRRGEYSLVHPNDHVNLNQSTNDVYPSACHMAIIMQWPSLHQTLNKLRVTMEEQAMRYASQQRIARTCLQDAVAVSFSDFFGGYTGVLSRGEERINKMVEALHVLPLGGTIVGRSHDANKTYFKSIVPALIKVTGDAAYRQNENLFDAAQNPDDMAAVSGALALLAGSLIKISQDLRLMNSGPETGFGEIALPPVQPGSSIMPGKINPVIPEFVIQVCFRVIGNDLSCQACVRHGELDLNIWESMMVFSILESMELLESALDVLEKRCVAGMEIDADRNRENTKTIIPRLTELIKDHGYSNVSNVCSEAGQDIQKLKKMIEERFHGKKHK